ncbi:neuropilin-1-like [Tubulanus polymorphus]|uniref:neuropilin-1-like n=1 Tax=Tubulanus polymorphus TaxID=672921 RepID=UPI003DA4252B
MKFTSSIHDLFPLPVFLFTIIDIAGCNAKCEYHFSSHTVPGGTFTTPNFPNNYPDRTYCKYIISGTLDERIRLDFVAFELEVRSEAGCLFDYVDILAVDHDGQPYKLGRLCGDIIPQPIISKYPKLEVIFKSDYVRGHRGFKAKYEFLSERWQPFPPSSELCGADYMTGPGGVLTSPGYPKPFIPDLECTWMIKVERHKRILLTFHELDLGPTVKCEGTAVSIYNGFATVTDRPEERVCGQLSLYEQRVKDFLSTGFRVVVRYRAGASNARGNKGFRLVWTAVQIPSKEGACEDGFWCAGGVTCMDSAGMLCNDLKRYCIAKEFECNKIPNCGFYDKSDEENCHGIGLQLGIIISVFFVLSVIVIVVAVVICRRRRRMANSPSEEQSLAVKLQKMDQDQPAGRMNGETRRSRNSKNGTFTQQNGRRKPIKGAESVTFENQQQVTTRIDPHDKNKAYQLILSCQSDDETVDQL